MLFAGLLTFLLLMSMAFVILTMLKFTRNNRLKNRQDLLESYRVRPLVAASQKINKLSNRFISSLGRYSRKSLLLEIATEFKNELNLGRYAIFELDKDRFVPIMSFGLNIKSIKSFKAELPSMENYKNTSINRIKGKLEEINIVGQTEAGKLAKSANFPEDINSLFMYIFKGDSFTMLFLGEDPNEELARYCLLDDFNKYVWPEIFGLYKHCQSLNKIQARIREDEYRESRIKKTTAGIKNNISINALNPQSMLNIANKLLSCSSENRLLESFAEYLISTLATTKIAVYVPNQNNVFKAVQIGKRNDASLKGKELSPDSQIYKLIMDRKTDAVITLSGGGSDPGNQSDAFVRDQKYSLMSRIYSNDKIAAVALIGERADGKAYTETDLVFMAGIANIAGLALENIARYCLVEKLSFTDSMTELYNYRYFYKRLNEEIYRAKRYNRELALVIFDIDNFKSINDSYGHQAGDDVLKKLAQLVLSSARAIDVVSRYGGEEFCVIMPDTSHASCGIFIERLRKMIAEHEFMNGQMGNPYSITVSCGAAIYPGDGQTADRLIYCADMALLEAKSGGRNRSLMWNAATRERDLTDKNTTENENTPENKNEV